MKIKETLENLPHVEIRKKFVEFLENPTDVKRNGNYFKDAIIADYTIQKGKERGECVLLYVKMNGSASQSEPYFGVYETGSGEKYEPLSLEEAVKCFQRVVFRHENSLVYRVYDAKLKDENETIRFCVSSIREMTFREEVKKGEILIDLDSIKLVLETKDRNEARSMAVELC